MFGWLKRSDKAEEIARENRSILNGIRDVYNSTALTWKKVWGIITHEQTTSDAKLRLSAVYCGLNLYTGSIIGLPKAVYRIDPTTGKRTRRVQTTEHPACKIFCHVANPDWTSDDMLSTCVFDVLYHGNFYALRAFDAQRRTARIYYIHPSRIPAKSIYLSEGGERFSLGYGMSKKGEKVYKINTSPHSESENPEYMLLPAQAMVHVKAALIDPEEFRGIGFYENAQRSMGLYDASEDFGHRFYSRGIATQMFLTTENRVAPDVLARLEAQFDQNPNRPLEDTFKTRILEQGLKPVHMGIPFQHLQFIETRAFSVEDISRWLNIPPALLHSKMGRGGSEEDFDKQINLFIQFGLGPLLTRITTQLRNELIPVQYHTLYSFEVERIYLFRTIINEFTQALRNLFEIGVVDREKIADILGMQIDMGDSMNNQRYVPTNLMTVEHSKVIEEKASMAITMMGHEIDQKAEEVTRLKDTPMPSEVAAQQAEQQAQADAPEDDAADTSPDEHNQDKRLRATTQNAFAAVVNSLQAYEKKVLDQKAQTRPEDYSAAVEEFYAADGKFHNLLLTTFAIWNEVLPDVSSYSSAEDISSQWIKNKGFTHVV